MLVIKNLPAIAGDVGDVGSVLRSGRSPGETNDNPLQILRREELDRLQYIGS